MGTCRNPGLFDVGAYESDGRAANPGWKVQGGFKSCPRHTEPGKVADLDEDSDVDFRDFSILGMVWLSESGSEG